MRTQKGSVLLVGLVQDANASVACTTNNLKAIRADLDVHYATFMLGLHEKLREVERPNSQELVVGTCHTEGFIHSYRLDCCLVCAVSGLKLLSLVVDLEHHSVSTSNEDSF